MGAFIYFVIGWGNTARDLHFTHGSFCCFMVDRECWMENMMTFQNSRFTWLEGLRRSLPRQRRLPRSLQPSSTPSLLFYLPLIIAKTNNLGGVGGWMPNNRMFHFLRTNVSGFSISVLIILQSVKEKWSGWPAPFFCCLFNKGKRKQTCIFFTFVFSTLKRVNVKILVSYGIYYRRQCRPWSPGLAFRQILT